MQNPFALFDLPIAFEIDLNLLSSRYLALQKQLHPDNFSAHSSQEQRLAMQKSAEINDALQTLKDPIARADAIIALHQDLQDLEQKTNHDMAFLMQQMEWREQLESLENQQDLNALEDFQQEIKQAQKGLLIKLANALAEQQWQEANALNDKLRFIKKLQAEIERVEEILAGF